MKKTIQIVKASLLLSILMLGMMFLSSTDVLAQSQAKQSKPGADKVAQKRSFTLKKADMPQIQLNQARQRISLTKDALKENGTIDYKKAFEALAPQKQKYVRENLDKYPKFKEVLK